MDFEKEVEAWRHLSLGVYQPTAYQRVMIDGLYLLFKLVMSKK